MRRVILQRGGNIEGAVMGVLYDYDFAVATLEERKVCVPEGTYMMIPDDTGRHHGWLLVGKDVAPAENMWGDRVRIEIHVGNTIEDTLGCPLVGMGIGRVDDKIAVTNSRGALSLLAEKLGRKDTHLLIVTET